MPTRDFKDVVELNAALRELGGKVPRPVARDAFDEAQELVFDAWQEESPGRRRAMALRARVLSLDCADAWNLLADDSDDPVEAGALFSRAVATAARALGPDLMRESVGRFWGVVRTRP